MENVLYCMFYMAIIYLVIAVPLVLLDFGFGILYKHNRGFRRRVNRLFGTMQWK